MKEEKIYCIENFCRIDSNYNISGDLEYVEVDFTKKSEVISISSFSTEIIGLKGAYIESSQEKRNILVRFEKIYFLDLDDYEDICKNADKARNKIIDIDMQEYNACIAAHQNPKLVNR